MPHKFNAARRHKFAKKRLRVTNWASYNESLRQRGDLTVWLATDALKLWTTPRRMSRGGQQRYSDMAITICLTLGVVYKQPLRQTQGLMRSIVRLMELEIAVPDFSTLSRRGRGLSLPGKPRPKRTEPVHLVVDSTGLKIFGEGEWLQNNYKTKAKRKSWRKLHLGLDLGAGKIICADLTQDDVGDPTALPGLLNQVDAPVFRFLADGAYDGTPTCSTRASETPSRSSSRLRRTPSQARNRRTILRNATNTLRRSKPTAASPSSPVADTISGAGAKTKWAAGRPSSGQN